MSASFQLPGRTVPHDVRHESGEGSSHFSARFGCKARTHQHSPLRLIVGMVVWGCAGLGLAGCQVTSDVQGTLISGENISTLRPGHMTQQDVLSRLGTPTYVLPSQPENWYYVCLTRETKAVTAPTIVTLRGYELTFDQRGVLRAWAPSTGAVTIAMSKAQSDLPVAREDSLLQKIFGGIKRFGSVRPTL